ncbi:MAG: PIN domain-containing protein [Pirellulales bacterium]|nr:PIN domain-containing protein [Pirellulales bacterium]
MKTRTLIDAGPLVALFNHADPRSSVCGDCLKRIRLPMYSCWPAITEAAYLLRKTSRGVFRLIESCDGHRIRLLPLDESDIPGIASILARYSDQGFDLADAALMWLAERDGIETVFTLDRRHFSVFRTSAGKPLTLLPGESELQSS